MTGELPKRLGNRHSSLAPYETFRTADGHVIVGVGNDSLWKRFCAAVERPDLDVAELEKNPSRVERYDELRRSLEPLFASRTTDAWVRLLEDAGIPVGRVRDVAEVFDNPQVASRRMRIEVQHPKLGRLPLTGSPIKLERSKEREHAPPPMLGEHTESVLREKLGLDDETLRALGDEGVFGT
jgi:crotonobetainyl-CoA:carnitine CoA-transferase CaiB-like acyl-CoA transferase